MCVLVVVVSDVAQQKWNFRRNKQQQQKQKQQRFGILDGGLANNNTTIITTTIIIIMSDVQKIHGIHSIKPEIIGTSSQCTCGRNNDKELERRGTNATRPTPDIGQVPSGSQDQTYDISAAVRPCFSATTHGTVQGS